MENKHTKTFQAKEVVTREIGGEERDLLKVPISSTSEDRDGDDFSRQGLESMRDQIKGEQPNVFPDHGRSGGLLGPRYSWDTSLGTQKDAEIENETLYSYILPDKTHPEDKGELLAEKVKSGQAVRFSVGFRAFDYDEKENSTDENPKYTFHDVDLMETSAVGVQSNRDAVVTNANDAIEVAKGLGDELDGLDEETVAKHIVSELYKAEGEQEAPVHEKGGDGVSENDADDNMEDDEMKELLSGLSESVDELNDNVKALSESDASKESEESEEKSEEEPTPTPADLEKRIEELEEERGSLEDEVAELRDAMDGDTEESDTDTVKTGEEEDSEDAEKSTEETTENGADGNKEFSF